MTVGAKYLKILHFANKYGIKPFFHSEIDTSRGSPKNKQPISRSKLVYTSFQKADIFTTKKKYDRQFSYKERFSVFCILPSSE